MTRALHIATAEDAKPENVAERIRRLQAEAQGLARAHVQALALKMAETEAMAREIARGGEAYHMGTRELAGRVADDLASKLLTLQQIVKRIGAAE